MTDYLEDERASAWHKIGELTVRPMPEFIDVKYADGERGISVLSSGIYEMTSCNGEPVAWWRPAKGTTNRLDVQEGKQSRYQDNNGDDWIDECARTFTPEEFRGAMKFNMGKYQRRYGKKDDYLMEAKKIADYANRLVEYETKLKKT